MLKSKGENKKYIWGAVTVGVFGIAGLLLTPVVMCVIKAANRYPKIFRCIFFTVFAIMCIYGFLFEQEQDMRFAMICIGAVIAVNSILNTDRR